MVVVKEVKAEVEVAVLAVVPVAAEALAVEAALVVAAAVVRVLAAVAEEPVAAVAAVPVVVEPVAAVPEVRAVVALAAREEALAVTMPLLRSMPRYLAHSCAVLRRYTHPHRRINRQRPRRINRS